MIKNFYRTLLLLPCILTTQQAIAIDESVQRDLETVAPTNISYPEQNSHAFNNNVGIVTIYAPRYSGSNDERWLVLPSFNYEFNENWVINPYQGLVYKNNLTSRIEGTLRLGADFGRKESNSSDLDGLGNVSASPEAGASLSYRIFPLLRANISVSQGLTTAGHNGLYGKFSLNGFIPWGKGLISLLQVSTSAANQKYMQSFYGVNSSQAISSGYNEYRPNSGLYDVGASHTLIYSFAKRWSLNVTLNYQRLLSNAGDSPFVKEQNQWSMFSGISYLF